MHVLEGDGGEPVDADVDVGRRFLAAGNVEVLALGGAGADEDGIEAFLEQLLEALDLVTEARFDAEVEDALDLLVEHADRQAEGGDVGAHQPAALGVLLEQHAGVAEREEVARHRERGGSGADQRDALAVLLARHLRQEGVDLTLVVGGNPLEAADGDRLLLDAAAPAGGLAGAVADAAQDARENVALPVQHEGGGIALLGDQTDVFGNGGMGRTSPLAVDDLVEVLRIGDVGRGRTAPASCRDVARLHYVVPVPSLQPVILQDRDALSQLLH